MSPKNNFTHHVDKNNVKIWSVTRLPFEPKGWLVDMREQIRQDLRLLNLEKDHTFCAYYISSDNSFCDVENILFYNVGVSYFNNLTKNGLIFERVFKQPPEFQKFEFPHFQHYSVGKNFFSYWKLEKELAKFSSAPIRHFSLDTKVDQIWYALKKGNVQSLDSLKTSQNFGLELKLNLNRETRLSSILKVLLDGIISAFQSHLNDNNQFLFDKISERLETNPEQVRELLLNEDNAVLGKNKLIHKRADSIQWNPKDDGLVKVQVFPKYSDSEYTTFSGKIFSVKTYESEDNAQI